MSQIKHNCKGCQKRNPGCHDVCPEFQAWKKQHDKEAEMIRIKKYYENYMK